MIGRTQKYAANTLPYYGTKDLVVDDHTTGDIIREVQRAHNEYTDQYDQIADDFWTGDAKTTAERLFKVLKRHVVYDVEHPDNQTVKSPGAIIHQGHGDCKHYACFTCGIAHALARKGAPITCKYRFVSDSPTETVHHVFAVISDGKNDYWVDPVLNEFNVQPHFYNTKDLPMALYRINGTATNTLPSRPKDLPMVGNIFKDIAHGISVNAQNLTKGAQQTIKKVEHGAEVNAQNAAKGAQQAVKKVEHIALNVGLAPARNAFLALLDLNAFNLATRMSDAWTNHHDQVAQKWKDLGGNESKLLSAINNGRKHKAYYHNQAPAKKLAGDFHSYVSGCTVHAQQPLQLMEVPTLQHAYSIGPDARGRLPVVSGIGEPVSIATMAALASAIIAAFAHFMKPDKGDQNAVAAAQDGVANIVSNASDAIDAGQTAQGQQLLNMANQGANALNKLTSASGSMNISAGYADDGTPTVAVTDMNHPQLNNAGSPDNSSAPDQYLPATTSPADNLTTKAVALPGQLATDTWNYVTDKVRWLWDNYKTPIVFSVVGVGVYKVATRKRKRRR